MLPMFEITSGRVVEKYTKFEEAFNLLSNSVSCERISRILYIYTVWNITYMEEKHISVDLLALFHISNGLATFFIFVKMYAC